MTVWFTSDLHLGHDREFIWGVRGFGNVWTMNEFIVKTIHQTVQDGDVLYFLGDIALGYQAESRARRLFAGLTSRGIKVVWHVGNHDRPTKVEVNPSVELIPIGSIGVVDEDPMFVTSHFPVRTFERTDRNSRLYDFYPTESRIPDGCVLLHGHTHRPEIRTGPRSVHIGWDAWSRPVALSEIRELVDSKPV